MLSLKPRSFAARIQKLSQFGPPTQKKSQSITTPKPSQFRSAQSTWLPPQNQVHFNPKTKTMSNSIHHTKIKLISTWILKLSHSDPPSKIKSIMMPRHKTKSISIQKPHENQPNSDPDTEIKPSSIPHTEIKSISTTTQMSSKIRSPTQRLS